jgi:hypothetical protein
MKPSKSSKQGAKRPSLSANQSRRSQEWSAEVKPMNPSIMPSTMQALVLMATHKSIPITDCPEEIWDRHGHQTEGVWLA